MRVLLVEDDPILADGIVAGLKQVGYAVDHAATLREAESAFHFDGYAAVILDIVLPDGSGRDLVRRWRERGSDVPVLLLTARDTVADRVSGLDAGADDYLVKPFDFAELLARVRALIRRGSRQAVVRLRRGGLELDTAAREARYNGAVLALSRREFALLHALMQNTGTVMSRAELERSLYSWGEEVESNAVEVHIHHLRRKLGAELIRTVRGAGYVIDPER